MNSKLPSASQRSPFHATTINMAGMLLCIFTTLAVLLSVSHDQTGAAVAEVTAAFNGAMRDRGQKDIADVAASFHEAVWASKDEHSRMTSRGGHVSQKIQRSRESSAAAQEEDVTEFPDEKLHPSDVNGPVFSHLVTELQRHYTISPKEELEGQLALDLQSQIPQSDDSVCNAIEKILKTCQMTSHSTRQSTLEFEVIVWASTPATDALAAASQQALSHEKSIERSLKAHFNAGIPVQSSGRIWTDPNSRRPVATVLVRTAKR